MEHDLPDEAVIEFAIRKAKSLEEFRLPDGKRNMHMHYFQYNPKHGFYYKWIEESTDVSWLKERIAEGVIYVFND